MYFAFLSNFLSEALELSSLYNIDQYHRQDSDQDWRKLVVWVFEGTEMS